MNKLEIEQNKQKFKEKVKLWEDYYKACLKTSKYKGNNDSVELRMLKYAVQSLKNNGFNHFYYDQLSKEK